MSQSVSATVTNKDLANRMSKAVLLDGLARYLLLGCAGLMTVIVMAIIFFVAQKGTLTFNEISLADFFFSAEWDPEKRKFGGLPFIIGSLQVTILSILLATPLALACSIFFAKIAPKRIKNILRPAVDLYVAVPSIVYGYIGLTVFIPFFREVFGVSGGFGLLPAVCILAVMILPTIITLSEDAINSVPKSLEEASIALGATRLQTIYKVILPSATSGIISAVILGMARAIGETMAVQMVIGNAPIIPTGLFMPTSTLTSNIVVEMGNAPFHSTWNNALFLMAFILLLISLGIILLIRYIANKGAMNHAS